MRLHLFNPENDSALAAGTANYTPTKSVAAFKKAHAWLPLWLADDGDNVWAPDIDRDWWAKMCEKYGLNVGLEPEGAPTPWGWSSNAVAQFRRIGIQGPFPDVETIRRLSHRRTALLLRRELAGRLPYPLPAEPIELTDLSRLPSGYDFFLKAPWSCSGRGVTDCRNMTAEAIRRRADGIIRRQGSVMLEPALDKIRDFAMLFRAGNGQIEYQGLSLFFTNGTSAYAGNIVASEEELRADLNAPFLTETIREVGDALQRIIGHSYEGPLGVDMMLHGPDRLICPDIEVNLRCTMGFVALSLARRYDRGQLLVTPSGADFIRRS